jgi:2-keto-3-deoxy-L-rhamnonate aldolase RhmA
MVESAAQATAIVRAVRYPPDGDRSYGVFRSTGDADPIAAAREVIVLPMVESAAGLEHVEAIVAVEGVDGVFIGPGDLGQSLGHGLGQNRTEPEMVAAFHRIRGAAHAAGRRCGIFATTVDYARECAAVGYDLVVPWLDSAAIGGTLTAASMP